MEEEGGIGKGAQPVGVPPPSPKETLWIVQVMRGVAALLVVIGHSQSAAAAAIAGAGGHFARSTLVPWGAGVDLFFVISGFIMVHASARLFGQPRARRIFLRRRLIRIAPLYWLATTGFLLLLGLAALKGGDAFPGPRAILASYAFVPFDTHGDGRLFPVFDLGWTLNYEMFFYALFALVVGLPRFRALATLTVVLGALVALGTQISGPSVFWFWTRPILLDFGLGLAVGSLVARGIVLPGAVRAFVALAGMILLVADPGRVFGGALGTTVANEWPRVVCAGMPVAAVLAAAVLGREPAMPRAAVPFTHVGDASYFLYLFHPVSLIAMEKLAQKMPALVRVPGWLIVAITVASAIGIALVGYRRIERPMTAWLAGARRVARSVPFGVVMVD